KFEKSTKDLDDLLGKQNQQVIEQVWGFKDDFKGKEKMNQEDSFQERRMKDQARNGKKENSTKDNVKTKSIRQPNAS
ncbi:hypothetical protein KI387_031417, partial [Taxus chinensis]